MASYYAQVTLAPVSGASEDIVVNGFSAGQIGTLDASYATDWTAAIKAFYDAAVGHGACKGSAQNNHLVKFYDIAGGAPNYPLFERTFNFASNPGAWDLPAEVALCISYANVSATTIPRARRRGRIYLSGHAEVNNTTGVPSSGVQQNFLDDFSDYVLAFNLLGTLEAGIWSRTNNTVYPIETAWVDNAWDTMRSRGQKPTARVTWNIP